MTLRVPQSYQQLAGMGYVVPARLFGMANNISPRYRIEISVSSDEYTPNNAVNKVVRFFVARSNVRMLATARGASVDLYSGTPTQNQIASRLNIDSVTYTLERIGYANNPAGSVIAYDVLDRDNFEERAIDYSIYRTVFWSSDNNPLTRFERRDLRAYVASGTALSKKNLAIAGQNYPRQHVGMDVINDQAFIQSVLRVNNVPPGNPVPTALTYHNRRLRGDAITRNSVETLFRTGFLATLNRFRPLCGCTRIQRLRVLLSAPTTTCWETVRQRTRSWARPRPRLCRMLSTWVLTGASTASRASAPAPSA